ncbi:hypothetical protein KNE206_53230 [Kitasatospora sp. NE20-6]|uniref:DUF317 domain-containing protein n=1 Tax=Kitasatospora sp. NE20-6 TaxID=2859066 RepID=UPI0034DBB4C2
MTSDPSFIHVQPAHLAGPGDSSLVTEALLRIGWVHHPDPGLDQVSLHSLSRTATLRRHRDAAWSLVCHTPADGAPAWSASFTPGTPAEVVAASALAMAQSQRGADHRRLSDLGTPDAFFPRASATALQSGLRLSWAWEEQGAHLDYCGTPKTSVGWSFVVRTGQQDDGGWRAGFTPAAPLYAINAALEAAFSTTGVLRRWNDLPAANLARLSTPTPAGRAEDRRTAALSFVRPVRITPPLSTAPVRCGPGAAPVPGSRHR